MKAYSSKNYIYHPADLPDSKNPFPSRSSSDSRQRSSSQQDSPRPARSTIPFSSTISWRRSPIASSSLASATPYTSTVSQPQLALSNVHLTHPKSRLRNLPSPSRQRRTPPPTRTMAHQPPSPSPIPRPPPKHPSRSNHNPVHIRSTLPISPRPSPPPLPSNSRNRSHAPRPLHDRQIPHRPSIPLQGPPHPLLPNRRRPRASPKRPAQCHGLARYPGHILENEELHSYQVCLLLTVCFFPISFSAIAFFPRHIRRGVHQCT